MKKWNTPEVEELNITETKNGIFDSEVETFLVFNDNKKPAVNTPVADDEVDKLS